MNLRGCYHIRAFPPLLVWCFLFFDGSKAFTFLPTRINLPSSFYLQNSKKNSDLFRRTILSVKESKNDNEKLPEKEKLNSLLDRAMNIYVALPITMEGDSDSFQDDMNDLRRREITKLVEDISHALNNVNVGFGGSEEIESDDSSDVFEKFDDAILSAINADLFDEEILTGLASNLLQESSGENYASEPNLSESDDNIYMELKKRLEGLELLVDPLRPIYAEVPELKRDNKETKSNDEVKVDPKTVEAENLIINEGDSSLENCNEKGDIEIDTETELLNEKSEPSFVDVVPEKDEPISEASLKSKTESNGELEQISKTANGESPQNVDEEVNGSEILAVLLTIGAAAVTYMSSNPDAADKVQSMLTKYS